MKKPGDELAAKATELISRLEALRLAEYVELLQDNKRLWRVNFLAGLARGLGTAVGFTILGTLVLYLLQRLVRLNLPLIGDFIAEIVRLVMAKY